MRRSKNRSPVMAKTISASCASRKRYRPLMQFCVATLRGGVRSSCHLFEEDFASGCSGKLFGIDVTT
ncbi:hypothetical protein POSPLADRAFT_1043378 [Postia placenta MAD-698-R-SB12]|uniref:Uncharacterized protein n=1 Tax=Postia placenta MAD-698-R-SB12 TaxID=670580 RepID=A0A1X6NBG8_9APHY|nr:hypothetical protein POSPLADRAFT_1043378 [Postia placenta MAD-698-R-SB12]OSX65786.1 hypothetical protein POSPLADRAFT_1043378 [Postia placenta MAD-698-R-SB12]